jgi:hypothetical protein
MNALKRLFADAGIDPRTEQDLDRVQMANTILFEIFQTHGEALVEVLEQIVRDQENPRVVAMTSIYDAKQLLAALERDAGEGL